MPGRVDGEIDTAMSDLYAYKPQFQPSGSATIPGHTLTV
jgi:hypothetical protein